jgi:hypothetical protein
MNPDEIMMFAVVAGLAAAGTWFWYRHRQAIASERMKELEIRHEMIKKFSSAQEFIDFVRSEDGRKIFFDEGQGHSRLKIIRSITASVILALAGAAMFFTGYSWSDYTDINEINKMRDYYYWGSLSFAAAAGLLVNAWLMNKLGKKWNVFKDPQ